MKKEDSLPISPVKIIKSTIEFPVVGVGASAGGLDSFKKFIGAIPENSGMAFILIQHLAASHESVLPALLNKYTSLTIHEITDNIEIAANHIYIIPANSLVVANDGVLQLSVRPPKDHPNYPINTFFTSLAEVHGENAVGIVLSGTGTDGTLGMQDIKSHGGLTFAEDPLTAAYDGMPVSAIQAGAADFVLKAELIPLKLTDINRQVFEPPHDGVPEKVNTNDIYKKIISLVHTRKGNDFTFYKQSTIRRRILRRIALRNMDTLEQYLHYLQNNVNEQDTLYQDLLIPVTSFFRDKGIFDMLCESVLPQIQQSKSPVKPIRIWVAGCSTGQEAYSFAICLSEYISTGVYEGHNANKSVQIFATDISEPAIAKARSGLYSLAEMEGLSQQRIDAFFTKHDGSFQVNKSVREMCVFAVHNFLKDPPFAKVDLVSCRNVLIYMEPYLQAKAMVAFHYALNSHGYLMLGKAESTPHTSDLFASAGKNAKLFNRINTPSRFIYVPPGQIGLNLKAPDIMQKKEILKPDFQQAADEVFLSKFTPAGVVINDSLTIVHSRGGVSKYLELLPGKASLNVISMARPELAFELRNLLHRVKHENIPVIKENILVSINNEPLSITMEAIPLANTLEPHIMILFHEDAQPKATRHQKRQRASENFETLFNNAQIELQQLREDIRIITGEQEAANDVLQNTNDELLSGSEELQSLNEELEAGKEELQSTNEELTVLNQEMIGLNEQLREARNYADAIISTIREPLIVIDENMRVKSANRAYYETFDTNELQTQGNNFFHLADGQWNIPELRTQLEMLLPHSTKFSDLEISRNFPKIGHRVMLFNGVEMVRAGGASKLILLAIQDITEKALRVQTIEAGNKRYQQILLQSPFAFSLMKGKEMVITVANDLMKQFWGKGDDVEGKRLTEVLPEISEQLFPEMLDKVYTSGNAVYANEMLARLNHNGTTEDRYFNIIYQPHREADDTVSGVITIAHEVTPQVIARKKMEQQALMVSNMLMTAPGFVATLDGPDHVYQMVNAQYQNLFGKRKLQGKPIMVALPELKGQGFEALLDHVYTTGEPYVGIDVPINLARDEGLPPEKRYFNFSYQPIYNEDQKIYSILIFGYEVTDQVLAKNKNLESEKSRANELNEKVQNRTIELSKANDELRKINEELESFTYISSHDLQEPLRKIQSFSSRILDTEYKVLSEKGKDYLHRTNLAAARMQKLIEDLLAYSHAQIGDRKFEKTDLDILINDIRAEFGEVLQEHAAVINADGLGYAFVSPGQFRQLINNLVTNSIKFARQDVPPVMQLSTTIGTGTQHIAANSELRPERLSPLQLYCHICYRDNGIGFDDQYKDRIFQVFQRLHNKEVYPGTGIGLAIVHKIVDNHNGYIMASGDPGVGAKFDIYIPHNVT